MKLLVATEFPPDAAGGGPAIVRQMLEGMESSTEIFWWSVLPGKNSEVRGQKSEVSDQKSEVRGQKFESIISKHFCGAPPGKLIPQRKFSRLKAWLMEHLWARFSARDFRRTLEEVRPECIWVIPHNWSILPIHRVLVGGKVQRYEGGKGRRAEKAKKLKFGNADTQGWEGRFHVTIQDYPDAHDHSAVWGKEICTRLNRAQDDLYRLATTRDATSLPMLEDLKLRTGARGEQMLHQGLEKEDFEFLEASEVHGQRPEVRGQKRELGQGELDCRREPERKRTASCKETTESKSFQIQDPKSKILKIAYAGTILVPDEFASFVDILSQIRKTLPVELHLWGAHSYQNASWFDADLLVEHGNVSHRDLLAELRECDWGFIPMALKDTDPRYNRFSFPTKFITYLAAGLPVITLGHPESSVMKMAESYEVGVNLTVLDEVAKQCLREALSEPNPKARYHAGILRCAREQFDATEMKRKLWEAFEGK